MNFRAVSLMVAVVAVVGVIEVAGGAMSGLPVAQRRGSGRPGASRGVGESPWEARTLVRGRVQAVDAATGRVRLDVGGTPLEAFFPAAVVEKVKAGDIVFVTVDVIDTRMAAVTGSVIAVEPGKGTMTVTTSQGPVTMPAAPVALSRVKPGDQVLLKLGLTDIGPPLEPAGPPTGTTSPK